MKTNTQGGFINIAMVAIIVIVLSVFISAGAIGYAVSDGFTKIPFGKKESMQNNIEPSGQEEYENAKPVAQRDATENSHLQENEKARTKNAGKEGVERTEKKSAPRNFMILEGTSLKTNSVKTAREWVTTALDGGAPVVCNVVSKKSDSIDAYFSQDRFRFDMIRNGKMTSALKKEDTIYLWTRGIRSGKTQSPDFIQGMKDELPLLGVYDAGAVKKVSCNKVGSIAVTHFRVPSNIEFLSLDALISARTKSRDAIRISDVAQIQVTLSMYLSQCGAYPSTLYGGASCEAEGFSDFIIPVLDPETDKPYIYDVNDSRMAYCLGADLENDEHVQTNADTFVMPEGTHCTGGDYYVSS